MKRWSHYDKDGFYKGSTKEDVGEMKPSIGIIITLLGILIILIIARPYL